ncbi:hypothetical protein GCM10009734_35710 [Nonomuraea bangladeshensis]
MSGGAGGRGTPGARWDTVRVESDKRPNGAKTLGYILLAMFVILAVLIGLSVWASRTG